MAGEDLSQLKIEKTTLPSGSAGRKRRRLLWISAAIAALVIIVLLIRGVFSPAVDAELATVVLAYPSQGFTLLNASGYVVAQRKASAASKATGTLVALNVEEGSVVRKGDVIARLENSDVAAARDQAAANLSAARATLDQARAELQDATLAHSRASDLLSKDYISRSDFDAADARIKKARAAVAGAESAISAGSAALKAADVAVEYTLIRAPFDAVVLTKNADIGDVVTPLGAAANAKAAVVTIADMGSLQVEVDVAESNLRQVKTGQPCEVQLDALPDARFRGTVHMVVPTADRSKASVLVKVKFIDEDRRILPEMSAKVAFLERPLSEEERAPLTAIPPDALADKNGRKIAYLVKDGVAVETAVTTGKKLGDLIEVTSGLKPGDRIVARPTDRIRGGVRIRPSEK